MMADFQTFIGVVLAIYGIIGALAVIESFQPGLGWNIGLGLTIGGRMGISAALVSKLRGNCVRKGS